NIKNPPTGLYDFFRRTKEPRTLRIFVMGESSAAGYPFYYGAAFSRQLAQRLQQTFPERRVEVVNTAMAAISSYALRDFTTEILREKPDAVLIYTGHNEYYGALGVGSSESLGRVPGFVNLYLRLQRFRVVQALRGLITRIVAATSPPAAPTGERSTLMERMVGEQRIAYGSDLERAGERQFRENMSAILGRFQDVGVPVFVGTLASNERGQPPFISAPATGDPAAWSRRVREAEAIAARDIAAAIAALERLVAADSVEAEARFALARLVEARGDTARARTLYLAAKDRDQLRFRASERLNGVLRAVAQAHGARVVETQAALQRASPQGIIGPELMTEHLHPTPEGYFVIADAFYEALRQARLGGEYGQAIPAVDARRERLLTPVDSLVGVYRLLQLRSVWPFQPIGVVAPYLDTLKARTPLEQIARDVFEGRVSWPEANEAQRRYFIAQGDLHNALRVAFAAIQEYPFSDGTYLAAGNVLVEQGRLADALPYFEQAAELRPTGEAEGMIGAIHLARGDARAALPHLERARSLSPDNLQVQYNLAGAYATSGRQREAMALLQAILRRNPNHVGARDLIRQLAGSSSGTGSSR
ncbi:MAG TPA: tetratricopeptide repeat protein, partial [Rhodothermales bacterium]|nr:tetratricopeptide repeat protein [Rhodothermales bacterium]